MDEKRLLVLCVDRDNDLGLKAGINGPVIGEKDVLNAAVKLGISDPSDSDLNAIFEALKQYRSYKDKEGIKVDIAIITGDVHVGTTSDTKLASQLEKVLEETGTTSVILVSDGAEDEYILPIVESRVKVDSVDRVIVRQSERLEGIYYLTLAFIKRVMLDPHLSKLFIGFPGIAALLLSLYGVQGWRIVAGIGGIGLIIKGFHLEKIISNSIAEFTSSYREGRVSFFMYLVAIIIALMGFARGVTSIKAGISGDPIKTTMFFIYGGIWWFTSAIVISFIGKILDSLPNFPKAVLHLLNIVYVITVGYMVESASRLMIFPDTPIQDVTTSLTVGICIILAISILDRKIRRRFLI